MDKVIKEIKENGQFSETVKSELLSIYDKYLAIKNDLISNAAEEKIALKERTEKFIEETFKFSVPLEFIDSSIGKVLFEIKLDLSYSNMYAGTELVIITQKSKNMINMDFRDGNIQGIGAGTKNRLIVSEDELIRYMVNVGRYKMSLEEARERVAIFKKMQSSGSTDEEIDQVIRERFGKRYTGVKTK